MMSSLLAVTGLFSACSTDLSDDYPAVSVSLTAGEVSETSISFTLEATGADQVYYWVLETPAEGAEESNLLDLSKAKNLDAELDLPFSNVVTVNNLVAGTEYSVYAYAMNYAHSGYATPIKMTTGAAVAVPTVSVALVDTEVYADSFLVLLTTANAQKGAWLVVDKNTEGVTAETVFTTGTALAASDLNKTDVEVFVENLEASKAYDLYVAVENKGKTALSEVLCVTTAAPAAATLSWTFVELMQTMDLVDTVGLPGIYFTLASAQGEFASLLMYDVTGYPNYAGYLSSGDYPVLPGNLMEGEFEFASCILGDSTLTNFMDANGVTYYPVAGESTTDEYGMVLGVSLQTVMPDMDNNLLTFNIPVVDDAGNAAIIQGEYLGPLGYVAGGGGGQSYPFSLNDFGFTNFEMTTNGNTVTLISNSMNGEFRMVLDTQNGDITEGAFAAGEGGNLTGGFVSFLDGAPEEFHFVSGQIAFDKVDDNGNYVLIVSPRAGDWKMEGASYSYVIEAPENGYNITIAAPATASIDNKQWQLPAEFTAILLGGEYPNAVSVADLGVSMPGYLVIGIDNETVYGPEAAGTGTPMIVLTYTVDSTTATEGVITVQQQQAAGVVTTTLP